MRAHRDSNIGRSRWSLLAMVVALLLCFSPAAAMGQGIKDAVNDDSATEEATEEPFDPATEEATEEPLEPFDPATEEATEEPFDPVEQFSEWEDAGLIDDQSYESPQFGYTIDWSTDWAVDVFYDQPDEDIQPVMSNEDIEQDIIYLVWSGGTNEEAYAIYSGQTDNRGGPAGEVEEWTDPGYIESAWDASFDVEVLLDDTTRTSAAVLY